MIYGVKGNDYEMEQLMTYFLFAEYWGWTPKQVDELDVDLVYKLRYMLLDMLKEKERMSKKDSKEIKRVFV